MIKQIRLIERATLESELKDLRAFVPVEEYIPFKVDHHIMSSSGPSQNEIDSKIGMIEDMLRDLDNNEANLSSLLSNNYQVIAQIPLNHYQGGALLVLWKNDR